MLICKAVYSVYLKQNPVYLVFQNFLEQGKFNVSNLNFKKLKRCTFEPLA